MQGTERSSAGNSPLAELDRANLEQAMRLEAEVIAGSHPDILDSKRPPVPPVVVTVPADLCSMDLQVLVRHEFGQVFVDVRADSRGSWVPIEMTGGSFEVRAS